MTFEEMAYHFQVAEKYLVKVIEPNIAAESLNDLRCVIYATRKTTFSKLTPTSSAIKGHLLWAHYFINICFNILDTNEPKLQPVNFGSSTACLFWTNSFVKCYKNL